MLERLFLIDGNAIAYRAYYTFKTRPLFSPAGEPTSAVYGFTSTLLKILQDDKPEYIGVVFDRPELTFRHNIYTDYKATRQKIPEDMIPQLSKLKEVVEVLSIPILELAGYEADDIIGTLAFKAKSNNIETYIVTSDKDMMQLVDDLIKIYRPGKKGNEWEILGKKEVTEYFGVEPEKVIDVLGLAGDKSDNIPGIPGIGEIIATNLVKNLGTIEQIYDNIDKVDKPALKEKLKAYKENAYLSKKLVTIDTNVPINVEIRDLKIKDFNKEAAIKLFNELGFRSLLKKLLTPELIEVETVLDFKPKFGDVSNLDQEKDNIDYKIIKTRDDLKKLYDLLSNSELFVFDTETTSSNPHLAKLVGISFSVKPKTAYYLPIKYDSEEDDSRLPFDLNNKTTGAENFVGFEIQEIHNLLGNIFSNEKIKKCGQNIKYDLIVLKNNGFDVNGIYFDTMVANYVLKPEGSHNLDSMALQHLNYKMITYQELLDKRKDIRDVPLEKVAIYSAEDADITLRLYYVLKDKLEKEKLLTLCEKIEFPLIPVLTEMEYNGLKLDKDYLLQLSKELDLILSELLEKIYEFVGYKFNVNSTQQLSKILFQDLKLKPTKRTKTGLSTDVSVLEKLKDEHPLVEKLLEYRTVSKIKSTYVDSLQNLVNPKTGRVHTSFNQTITSTGRLSSSNPNLQNIPIRTELGKKIRRAFIPENAEWKIISADYSQIELRIMAHISDDPGLKEAFIKGEDIHATTASKIFGYTLEEYKELPKEIQQDLRRKAKEINFGIMYGLGVYGLANNLGIEKEESREIIEKYHKRFPNVKKYINETIKFAQSTGYVETLLGRRRYFPDINSQNKTIRGNAERQAINMPIQGTAADMIKLAMIGIHNEIKNKPIRMLLQVHDELIFESRIDFIEEAKEIITRNMMNAIKLSVPVEVQIGIGDNWYEAH